MVKDRNGGDRDGLGIYELTRLCFRHPVYYNLVILMLKFHMKWLARKMLGIH